MISFNDVWRYGPLLILALSVAVSVSVGGISVGLVYLAALVVLAQERKQAVWPEKSVLWALGALLGSYFLATLFSMPYPHDWHKFVEELWIKLLLIAIPIVVGRDSKKVIWALKLALVIGAVAAVYAVVQHFLGVDPIRDRSLYRPQFGHSAVTGFFSHHLSFAGQTLIFLIMTTAWYLHKPTDRKYSWLPAALAALTLALLWSFARGTWIGVLVGLPVLVMLQAGRTRIVALASGLVMVAGVLLINPVRDHFLRIFQMQQHATRLNLWESSWAGIKGNPLLGFGPGNFEALLDGFKVPGHYETLAHSHNDLLMHGVNAGIPGILAALALLWVTCRLMLRAGRINSGYQWIFKGTFAVQVGITVAGVFQVFQTDDEVEILLYFLLGCALALAGQLDREVDQSQSRV
jgi:hypothetical protein